MLNVKIERLKHGLTQQDVADKCGVIRQTISNIECGVTKPSVDLAKKLGETLKVDWTKFFDN